MLKLLLSFFLIVQGTFTMAYGMENGVYAAALTPFDSDLRCNDELLTKHCLQLIDRGCKGVVLFGTTGEGPSFSIEEKKDTLNQVITHGLDPKHIIVGNGSGCVHDTVEIALASIESNCLACLIAPPCFFKNVSEEGVISFYREVIQRVSDSRLKIILYHIPQFSKVPITLHIVKTLTEEFPDIVVGIKDSEGNLSLIKEILQEIPHFKVFAGNEKQIPTAMHYGASGAISGMANLWPEYICDAYEKGDISGVKQILILLGNRPFIPFCKALLSGNNPNWNQVRPPLIALSQKETSLLKQKATALHLTNFK